MVERLFGIKAVCLVRGSRGSAGDLVISSVALVEFLERLGLRRGSKRPGRVAIPRWVEASLSRRMACLRGLIDTDGSIYPHRYRSAGRTYIYPKLSFTSIIPALCRFVESTLRDLHIRASYYPSNRQVFVSSTKDVRRYFEIVGTHNPRYRERFQCLLGEVAEWSKAAVC